MLSLEESGVEGSQMQESIPRDCVHLSSFFYHLPAFASWQIRCSSIMSAYEERACVKHHRWFGTLRHTVRGVTLAAEVEARSKNMLSVKVRSLRSCHTQCYLIWFRFIHTQRFYLPWQTTARVSKSKLIKPFSIAATTLPSCLHP